MNTNNDLSITKEFKINTVDKEGIINNMDLGNQFQVDVLNLVIDTFEDFTKKSLKDFKAVQIPYLGIIRLDPIKKKVVAAKEEFRTNRINMPRAEYRAFVDKKIKSFKEENTKEYFASIQRTKNKAYHKTGYEKIFKKLGKVYADMWLFSRSNYTPVEFDEEFEEHIQYLNSKD